jgi:hypothetical protein
MAIKSVIDIEINQEAFKEFESLFAKYQSNLGKMPGQWGKVGSATSNTAKTFNEAADALVRAAEAMQGIANAQDKVTKGQNKFNQFAQSTSKNFQEVSKSAIQIGKSVAATTLNLMKWVGIGGALGLVGGAGGLFGIGGLATSVGDTRKRAQGLGVTAGELKATETNFQRYTDVNALLSNLASAQTDIAKQYAFQANQLDANQSAADLLPKLLRRAGEVYKQGPAATAQQ